MNTAFRFVADHFRRAAASRDPHLVFEERMTFGEKLADRVATVGGSWSFIIGFGVFLVGWALFNTLLLATHAFDPFPYIFLNLMLSMLAALQAPVIMMSQNRQAMKDRFEARLDYEINQRAEAQITTLLTQVEDLRTMIEALATSGGTTDRD